MLNKRWLAFKNAIISYKFVLNKNCYTAAECQDRSYINTEKGKLIKNLKQRIKY
jgi:hypothetical protein